jgi:transcriptional regulatory protein LevR
LKERGNELFNKQAITNDIIQYGDGQNGTSIIVRELCEEDLRKCLLFLNPFHITALLLDWLQNMQDELGVELSNTVIIRIIMHTAFTFERMIKNTP